MERRDTLRLSVSPLGGSPFKAGQESFMGRTPQAEGVRLPDRPGRAGLLSSPSLQEPIKAVPAAGHDLVELDLRESLSGVAPWPRPAGAGEETPEGRSRV